MNRREFLGGAIAMGVALHEPARARLRIGFMGVAHSHAEGKIAVILASPDYEIAGFYGETPQLRAEYEAKGLKSMDPAALLDACEVVAVETQNADHERYARMALEADRHVHLEKPPAVTLGGLDELLRLARDQKRLLQVGYMWRQNPAIVAALEAAKRGWLGEVYLVRATMNNDLDAKRRPEWARFPGGVMFELGCHVIDPVVRLLGVPSKIRSVMGRSGLPADSLADNTVALFEYPRAVAVVTSSTLQPNGFGHRTFEVCGTKGTATVKPIDDAVLAVDLAADAGPYKSGPQTVPMPRYERYKADFAELARCIRDGKPLPVSPETERDVQQTLLAACGMSE